MNNRIVRPVIDPGAEETWPEDVANEVNRLAVACQSNSENKLDRVSYDLSLGSVQDDVDAESSFRSLLADRPISLFHATRLLPHERKMIEENGLVILTEEHRSMRLDRVVDLYGSRIGEAKLEQLRSSGPLTWNSGHREGRLGVYHGVTPIDAFHLDGDGMEVFLKNWGGESFYWARSDLWERDDSTKRDELFDPLNELSQPYIVELAAFVDELCNYRDLWKVFVGQSGGWAEPWNEFSSSSSVPPERVLDFIGSDSQRWPYDADFKR